MGKIRFIADAMLGSLAKWLRAMGEDVAYDPFLPDNRLMRLAREEGRIILTRDTRMILVRDVPLYIFIRADTLERQLAQVIEEAHLKITEKRFLTRCMFCNGVLKDVDKKTVRNKVYPYVYATQKTFRQCPACEKIYWQGTHLLRIREKLESLLSGDTSA